MELNEIKELAEKVKTLTKEELVDLLYYAKGKNNENIDYIDLCDLDFSKYDCSVFFSKIKVNGHLIQRDQIVNGELHQCNCFVNGDLLQDNQKVKGNLIQCDCIVDGFIEQSYQTAKGTYKCSEEQLKELDKESIESLERCSIAQEGHIAYGEITQGFHKTLGNIQQGGHNVKGDLFQDRQKVGGGIFQGNQKANDYISQDEQVVYNGNLYQSKCVVNGSLSQKEQIVKGTLIQSNSLVGEDLDQRGHFVKGDIGQYDLCVGGEVFNDTKNGKFLPTYNKQLREVKEFNETLELDLEGLENKNNGWN